MQKLKLIVLLKKLSPEEVSGFRKYLIRHHHREKIGLSVFEYLIKFYPDFEQQEKIHVAYAYKKIFKTDFDHDEHAQKKMLNTASDLYKWLKNYLIAAKVEQNHQLQQTIWLGILQERGMKEEFSRKATEFYEQTRGTPFKSPLDAFPNWMASYFHRAHLTQNKPLNHAEIILQCTEAMTSCWEVMQLKMACETSLIKKTTEQVPALQIRKAIDFQQLGMAVLKEIYEALWQLTDSEEEAHFVRLETLLHQHGQSIDPQELEGVIRYAYNFAAHQSRQNTSVAHIERMHRLNKIGLEHGVFLRSGHLPSSAFGNMVTVACQSNDFRWASNFIQTYSHIVHERNRQDAIVMAKAILSFESGKYHEVINLLKSATPEAHLDVLRAKSLLLRSYYEVQVEQDVFMDACVHFENLLRRSAKTKANRAMLAFVLILKRMVAQKSSKKVILNRIEKTTDLYSRQWLLEKAANYRARYAARDIAAKQHTPAA